MRTPIPTLVLLAVASLPTTTAGAAAVRVERPFALLAVRGDATTWTLHPAAPGAITAEATWRGAERLMLTLEGPGETGRAAREIGGSPLVLRFAATPELLRQEGEWRLSLVSLGGRPARGELQVTWPGEEPPAGGGVVVEPRDRSRIARIGVREARAAAAGSSTTSEPPPLPPPSGSGEVRRTVLPDGRVRLDHPDGSAMIYEVGCGSTRIAPDGTQSKLICQQVQGAGLPPPPADPAWGGFLGLHEEGLLQQIRFLVGQEAQAVANYLALESAETASVVERIDLRRRYVDRLLGLGL